MLYNMGKVHKAACPSVQFKVDLIVFKHQLIIVSCLVVLCAKALVGAFISKKAFVPFSNVLSKLLIVYTITQNFLSTSTPHRPSLCGAQWIFKGSFPAVPFN